MDQQIDRTRRRQRAPVQALFNQKGSEMRQVMTLDPHGVGRASRSAQVREELAATSSNGVGGTAHAGT
jgi:hypothetical protein